MGTFIKIAHEQKHTNKLIPVCTLFSMKTNIEHKDTNYGSTSKHQLPDRGYNGSISNISERDLMSIFENPVEKAGNLDSAPLFNYNHKALHERQGSTTSEFTVLTGHLSKSNHKNGKQHGTLFLGRRFRKLYEYSPSLSTCLGGFLAALYSTVFCLSMVRTFLTLIV